MVFHEPKAVAASNLTNRQIPPSRAIIACPVPNSIFVRSFCARQTPELGGLQRYTIICHGRPPSSWSEAASRLGIGSIVTTGDPAPERPSIIERSGYCSFDEICITTARVTEEANCVKMAYFVSMMNTWNGAQSALAMVTIMGKGDVRKGMGFGLAGMSVSAIMSDIKSTMPIEVDSLRLQAGISQQANQLMDEQTTECRDCFDLDTKKMHAQTNSLSTGATLLTTGGMAGILWLAIMSG